MKRVLYIVAHNEPKLHVKFTKAYTGNDGVQVVLDRRRGERRRGFGRGQSQTERRKDDRRWHDISRNLKAIGWAIVRVI